MKRDVSPILKDPMYGQPKKRRGLRAKPTARPDLAEARRACEDRARGACEARCAADCRGRGDQAHHRLRRSQGGPDTLDNLLWVCTPCHSHIHANPAESIRRGWLRRALGASSALTVRESS